MSDTFGPYTPIRRAGNLYFVSGQIGIDMDTKQAVTDVAKQTHQAMQNLQNVLSTTSLDMSDVVKTTVFLADMDDFAAMNEVYETYFDAPRPARSAVAVKELPRVAGDTRLLVEIEAVAYRETA
jgi:2-iminobutanoate/2-iminopropanoate deaminase